MQVQTTFDIDNMPRLKYVPNSILERGLDLKQKKSRAARRKYIHKGQRKLLLAELKHLVEVLSSNLEYAIVVYVGAAPTLKAWLVHEMFPNIKFLMIDPKRFDIKIGKQNHFRNDDQVVYLGCIDQKRDMKYFDITSCEEVRGKLPAELVTDPLLDENNWDKYIDFIYQSDNAIYLNQHYLTLESSKFINKLFESKINYPEYTEAKTIFWSDIRSGGDEENPANCDVLHDIMLCILCMDIIQPDYSVCKFRNFYDGEINTKKAEKYINEINEKFGLDIYQIINDGKIPFYPGIIYNQAWKPPSSSETRLWVSKQDILDKKIHQYDNLIYEEVNFHYNQHPRLVGKYHNPLSGKFGLGKCADCALEGQIWYDYSAKFGVKVDDFIKKLSLVMPQQIINQEKYIHQCA